MGRRFGDRINVWGIFSFVCDYGSTDLQFEIGENDENTAQVNIAYAYSI